MNSVAATSTTYKSVAFYATLDETNGTALRMTDGSVHFIAEHTGIWTTLSDADMPRIHLHGRCDLVQAQALIDGIDLVRKTSKTLQRRIA